MSKTILQLEQLFPKFNQLQKEYGDSEFLPIYGAGKVSSPDVMLIFMNPTGRNIASLQGWKGLRAPWIGTKQVWKLVNKLSIISNEQLNQIISAKADEWTENFAKEVYESVSMNNCYITNFAKCTMSDARSLPNSIFLQYKNLLLEEIYLVKPNMIVSFGNQVSSLLLSKTLSVSNYVNDEFEELVVDGISYKIYPTYYPVGQGQRNMPLAEKRLLRILNK
ncbi:hypothetical protein KC622_03305 [Candidatus Dojkabacteria bacterium]|uniref:Uracil-DNA glycosylase-like domain-containing protein n=1 Tax=Candidatus Dojkabacteria bacterium TaxID=2099670 RepID=A0A955KWX4_9BACT|nr:hypothetical protein [Candidatus Dojkabacteria bacterium]